MAQATEPATRFSRFIVQSSDVVEDARINVLDQSTNTVIWYKERYLTDTEIVEQVVHNATTKVCWAIHRPKRGWYIRIRSPSFPPGSFIPFMPVPTSSPHHIDAALSFRSRTSIPAPMPQLSTRASTSSIHSYPPSPPPAAVVVSPPSPKSIQAELDRITQNLDREPKTLRVTIPSSQVTEFILAPHVPEEPRPNTSFFARAFQVLKSHTPSQSNSFLLSRISAPPPYSPESSAAAAPSVPFLTFHDQTPVLTVRSLTGLIELDRDEERLLGVETSFWITVALTYLEFLAERDSYLAALSD